MQACVAGHPRASRADGWRSYRPSRLRSSRASTRWWMPPAMPLRLRMRGSPSTVSTMRASGEFSRTSIRTICRAAPPASRSERKSGTVARGISRRAITLGSPRIGFRGAVAYYDEGAILLGVVMLSLGYLCEIRAEVREWSHEAHCRGGYLSRVSDGRPDNVSPSAPIGGVST